MLETTALALPEDVPEEIVQQYLALYAEAEKLACQYAMEEYGHEFIFVTDFAKTKRAFYHMRENEIPQ